jgi:hypothetical protein
MNMRSRLQFWDTFLNRMLIFLVAASLVLTARIWVGTATTAQAYEPFTLTPEKAEDPGLPRLYMPSLLLLHQGGNVHLGMLPGSEDYNQIWQQGKALTQVLGAVGTLKKEVVPLQDVQQARQDGLALEFVLNDAYRLATLGQIYGVSVEGDFSCDRIVVSGKAWGTIYFRTSPSREYVAVALRPNISDPLGLQDIAPKSARRYAELADEIQGIRISEGTYVPRDTMSLPMLSVQRDPTGAGTILGTFFVDVSLLRKIEERDGALIYSDGRRGVRIYPSGAVDYSQPLAGGDVDPYAAVERAAVYAMQHGGLPGTAYVDRLSRQKNTGAGFRARFALRYDGVPLVGQRGIIEVLVGSKGPEAFLRNFRLPAGPAGDARPILPPRDAIAAISAARVNVLGAGDPGLVIGMELAYLVNGPEEPIEPLRPVWAVEFQNAGAVTVDAYSGAVARRVAP